jgi:prepilin-type N-terminal cleavage/methylation domain-containing protein
MGQLVMNSNVLTLGSQRMQRMHRRSRNRGVSMIEVMIALAILGYGMLGVAAAQVTALRSTDQSRDRMFAHQLAQQQLEIFQEMSRTSLEVIRADGGYPNDPLNPLDPDPNDGMAMAFTRTWTITPDTPEPNVYTILVNVAWTNSTGGARNLQLETFKSEL